MQLEQLVNIVTTRSVDWAINLVFSLAIWVIGRWAIKQITRMVSDALNRANRLDGALSGYIVSIVNILLTIMLVMFILARFGIETTSFAALIAGAGLAIGTAWGGLLAHFAAGFFIQVLRPFKVGDYITGGGTEGTVTNIGLFFTTILTPQNVTAYVGNNTIFSGNIQNFSIQAYRRIDMTAKIAHCVNPNEAIEKLRTAVSQVPNIKDAPSSALAISSFTADGVVISIQQFCDNSHYWQVYSDTNKAIADTIAANHWPAPETHSVQRNS